SIGGIRGVELAYFDPERSSGCDARQPLLNCSIDIIGMKKLREPATAHHLFGVEAGVLQEARIAVVDRSVRRGTPEHHGNGLSQLAQAAFTLAQLCFGLFASRDVPRNAQLRDGAIVGAQWGSARLQMATRTVHADDVKLQKALLPGADAFVERTISLAIFRRDEVIEVAVQHEIHGRCARHLGAGGVHAQERSVAGNHMDALRRRLDDGPKAGLTVPERVLRASALVNVGKEGVPTENGPADVPKRKPANLKPTIRAVEASEARFEVIGFTRCDPLGEDLEHAREII